MQMQPLADAIRPQTLDEVAGQKHLLGQGAMLRRIIESGTAANLIFSIFISFIPRRSPALPG